MSNHNNYSHSPPPSYANEGYKDKPIKPKKNMLATVVGFVMRHWSLVLALLFLVTTLRSVAHQKELRQELRTSEESFRAERAKRSAAERMQQSLQGQLDQLKSEFESRTVKVEKREGAWMEQVQLLQQATTRESRRAATEK
jgi:hypothetical protein